MKDKMVSHIVVFCGLASFYGYQLLNSNKTIGVDDLIAVAIGICWFGSLIIGPSLFTIGFFAILGCLLYGGMLYGLWMAFSWWGLLIGAVWVYWVFFYKI